MRKAGERPYERASGTRLAGLARPGAAPTTALLLALLTACSSPGPKSAVEHTPVAAPSSAAAPAVQPTSSPSATTPPSVSAAPAPVKASAAPTQPAAPPFASDSSPVTAEELGASYHEGCPVGPSDLRLLSLSYWGFDGAPHTGQLVVAKVFATDITKVFRQLYEARFPLRSMRPISEFGGNDPESMAADNTSAFNCRTVLGTTKWSEHAYGRAVDVNTVENPQVAGGVPDPPAGKAFVDRVNVRPGMAVSGSVVVKAFSSIGWIWGGTWNNSKDYQHFSSTGK